MKPLFTPRKPSKLFSPTKLQSYMRCGRQYLIEKGDDPQPQKVASYGLVRGTIGHKMLEKSSDIKTNHKRIFDEGIAYFESPATLPVLELDQAKKELMWDELQQMLLSLYAICDTMGVTFLRHEVSQEFRFLGAMFESTVDLEFTLPDTPKGSIEIGDFKFGQKKSQAQLNRDIQHGLYWYRYHDAGVKVYRNWTIYMQDGLIYKRNSRYGKAGERKGPMFYPVKITVEDIDNLSRMVSPALHGIANGVYMQNTDHCRTCQQLGKCPQFGTGATIQEEDSLEF